MEKGRGPAAPGRGEERRGQGTGGRGAERRPAAALVPALRVPPDRELLYGRNSVLEALRAGKRARRLIVSADVVGEGYVKEAVGLARQQGIPVEQVRRDQMDLVAMDHQGVAAVVTPFEYASWGDLLAKFKEAETPPTVLLLDTLHDPQNLGTLLRTSEAMGLDAVVLPKKRSVQVTPGVVRASAGAVEHMAVAQVPNLTRAVADLKEAGFWVAGIDMDGDRLYWDLDMTGPTALVLGGEDRGIGPLLKSQLDFVVRLPMMGRVNSLNAATAGSIVLYEMTRQRLRTGG